MHKFCDIRLIQSIRHVAAFSILFAIVSLAPLLTIFYNSVQTNSFVAFSQVALFLFIFRESVNEISSIVTSSQSIRVSIFLFLVVFLIVFSFISTGRGDRSFFYFSNVIFFFSLVYLFSIYKSIFVWLLSAKVLSVILICFVFLFLRILEGESYYDYVFGEPDIYRHLRHFNYDLMVGFGAIFILAAIGSFKGVSFYGSALIFCIFLMWTGGRGQLVALLIFLALLFVSPSRKRAVSIFPILALAFVLVAASGETEFLFGQMEKTLDSSSVNRVSSGRLKIWSDAWSDGLTAGFLGHGADAYREFGPNNVVQPHNSVIQFMFEYGFFGLMLCLAFFLWTGLACLRLILSGRSSGKIKVFSAFVISMYAYSLVDGIFYHAIPFSFMIIIAAAFFVELREKLSGFPTVETANVSVGERLG